MFTFLLHFGLRSGADRHNGSRRWFRGRACRTQRAGRSGSFHQRSGRSWAVRPHEDTEKSCAHFCAAPRKGKPLLGLLVGRSFARERGRRGRSVFTTPPLRPVTSATRGEPIKSLRGLNPLHCPHCGAELARLASIKDPVGITGFSDKCTSERTAGARPALRLRGLPTVLGWPSFPAPGLTWPTGAGRYAHAFSVSACGRKAARPRWARRSNFLSDAGRKGERIEKC